MPHADLAMTRRSRPRAFALAELLIVVMIIAILAAFVVPKLATATDAARDSTLREDLRFLRSQVMLYKAQRGGVAPGYPCGDAAQTPTFDTFLAQMTSYTDAAGRTSATRTGEFRFGPYLKRMPENPLMNDDRVRFVAAGAAFPPAPSGAEGWLYQPSTGSVGANVPGADVAGVRYTDY